MQAIREALARLSSSYIAVGFAFAVGSAALFAIRPIFVKLAYAEGVEPVTLIGLRMLFSAPIYAVLLWLFIRRGRNKVPITLPLVAQISGIGLFGYFLASFFDLIGLQYVSAQLGRMILYTYPTFVVILSALFMGQAITLRTAAALLVTYIGISVIFGHDLSEFGPEVSVGALWIIASGLSFSVYLILSKSLITKVGSQVFTCIALISASFGIFTYWAITSPAIDMAIAVNNTALIIILIIAIFCTVIPTFFTTAAVERIGAGRTGIVAMIGPAFTSVFAVLILQEAFTVYHLLGIVITVIGVSLLPRN